MICSQESVEEAARSRKFEANRAEKLRKEAAEVKSMSEGGGKMREVSYGWSYSVPACVAALVIVILVGVDSMLCFVLLLYLFTVCTNTRR